VTTSRRLARLGQRAAGLVGDADDHRPGPAHGRRRLHHLGRRPGLAQRDRQVAAVVDVGLVPGMQAGRGQPGRSAGRHLDQVAAVDGDVVGRAAGEQHRPGVPARQRRPHPVTVGRVPVAQAAEDGGLLGQFSRHQRAGDRGVIDHGRVSLA